MPRRCARAVSNGCFFRLGVVVSSCRGVFLSSSFSAALGVGSITVHVYLALKVWARNEIIAERFRQYFLISQNSNAKTAQYTTGG